MKPRRVLLIMSVLLASTLALAPTTPSQAQVDPRMDPPLDQLSGDDFDQAFLTQMSLHHATAVLMAGPAAANASHQETKDLAQGIITSRTQEIAQMGSWSRDWYGLDIPDPLATLGQMQPGTSLPGVPGVTVPGMNVPGMGASQGALTQPNGAMPPKPDMAVVNDLAQLPPDRLDEAFMTQMISHDRTAIDMAKLAPDRAAHQETAMLAQGIIQNQGNEIAKMTSLLGR